MVAVLKFAVDVLLGVWIGYVLSHGVVARECERLGSFYVGTTVYVCAAKGELRLQGGAA